MTMITGLAFLFYMVNPFLPLWCQGLITVHRIKTVLTLLSPIIFGAITAYIAYQQHLLARTQANISKDQRDIAHNKLRIENFKELYEIHSSFAEVYVKIFNFPSLIPFNFIEEFEYKGIKKVSRLVDERFSTELQAWAIKYIEEEKIIEDMIRSCWLDQQKCKFLFDDDTYQTIFQYINNCAVYFGVKKHSIDDQLKYPNENNYTENLARHSLKNDELIAEVTKKMDKFINVSDIIVKHNNLNSTKIN
ncbi:MAG: hypothetical protein ABF898_01280 [Acetobacter orientalis]